MEIKNLTPEGAEFVQGMLYLKKYDRPGYNAVLCLLARCHEKQGNEFDSLTASLQKLTRGDFKRTIKRIRAADGESVAPGIVDYIRHRWLGKGDAV